MIRRLVPVLLAPLVLAACGSPAAEQADRTSSQTSIASPDASSAAADEGADNTTPSTEADDTALSTEADGSTASTEPASDLETSADVVVPAALDFTAPLLGGGQFDGASAAGKPLVLWFWAPF